MAESFKLPRDEGISEVLKASENRSRIANGQNSNVADDEKIQTASCDCDTMEPHTENADKLGENHMPADRSGLTKPVNSNEQPQQFTGQIDLSDPDSVIEMLENVDLTEEDTELLLQEAYSMNRKLKEILRRQEAGALSGSKEPTKSQKSKSKGKMGTSQGSSTTSSSSGSRVNSSFGARSILPPITGETSVYAIKLKRSSTEVPVKWSTNDLPAQRSRSTKQAPRKETGSPTRRHKTLEPKPEWNDRFSYS
ncbi:uncharacterized protein LOC127879750 isoform X2 [Dreissena polymorpha]|uniref:uncharacterized protein LOC127879750 isoform X2 n=1 Tax=Dreissena polymorpha TaxID=45954 RepID=UPI00226541C5|nr:uncharacterized protein LOC127879750 isoform X2 [Dreissena polymorpha]